MRLTLCLLALTLAACDSTDGPSGGGAAGELATANAKIGAAVAAGLAPGLSKTAFPACPNGGSVDVIESDGSYRMTFTNCGDVSGTFDVRTLTAGTGGATLRFDGDLRVRNSCDVSYDAFTAGTQLGTGGSATLTYDGRIDASCPSGRTTCTFDDASFSVSQSGAAPDLSPYCD